MFRPTDWHPLHSLILPEGESLLNGFVALCGGFQAGCCCVQVRWLALLLLPRTVKPCVIAVAYSLARCGSVVLFLVVGACFSHCLARRSFGRAQTRFQRRNYRPCATVGIYHAAARRSPVPESTGLLARVVLNVSRVVSGFGWRAKWRRACSAACRHPLAAGKHAYANKPSTASATGGHLSRSGKNTAQQRRQGNQHRSTLSMRVTDPRPRRSGPPKD